MNIDQMIMQSVVMIKMERSTKMWLVLMLELVV